MLLKIDHLCAGDRKVRDGRWQGGYTRRVGRRKSRGRRMGRVEGKGGKRIRDHYQHYSSSQESVSLVGRTFLPVTKQGMCKGRGKASLTLMRSLFLLSKNNKL